MNPTKKAVSLGSVCVITYLASYLFRNLLSVYSNQMVTSEVLTAEAAAYLASVYMVLYAAGQLICGTMGDHIKPKYMVAGGLIVTGTGLLLFPLTAWNTIHILSFGILGFGLAALRGPLVRLMASNMSPSHARIACTFLTLTASVGPLIAGLMIAWMRWNTAYFVSAGIAYFFAVFSFVCFTVMEKRGMIAPPPPHPKQTNAAADFLSIFKIPHFVMYLLVETITETAMTGISFWIPTYLSDCLGFTDAESGTIFAGIQAVKITIPFLCIFLLRLFKNRDLRLVGLGFFGSALSFAAMVLIPGPWVKILFFVLALVFCGLASNTLWSVYLPSLAKYNKVSTANGLFDCVGYGSAALANVLFAAVRSQFSWNGVVLSWCLMTAVGVLIAVGQTGIDRIKKRTVDLA